MAHSRVIPKDSGEGRFFQWVEFQVVDLVINLVWREKWPGGRVYTDFWAVVDGSLIGQGTCRNEIRKSKTSSVRGK